MFVREVSALHGEAKPVLGSPEADPRGVGLACGNRHFVVPIVEVVAGLAVFVEHATACRVEHFDARVERVARLVREQFAPIDPAVEFGAVPGVLRGVVHLPLHPVEGRTPSADLEALDLRTSDVLRLGHLLGILDELNRVLQSGPVSTDLEEQDVPRADPPVDPNAHVAVHARLGPESRVSDRRALVSEEFVEGGGAMIFSEIPLQDHSGEDPIFQAGPAAHHDLMDRTGRRVHPIAERVVAEEPAFVYVPLNRERRVQSAPPQGQLILQRPSVYGALVLQQRRVAEPIRRLEPFPASLND